MNILVVSDNPLFSLGLRSTIISKFPLTTFFEANSLQRACGATGHTRFDLMVLDAVSTKDSKTVELIKQIKEQLPAPAILVDLGDQLADLHFYIRLGANAFVSARATPGEVQEAVTLLAADPNNKYVSSDIEQLLLSQLTSNSVTIRLTSKEKIIANLLISSKPRSEIAQIAGINPNAVSTYKRVIFEKLGIGNISQLRAKLQPVCDYG
ncbi:response regulator transcription factor [Dyadobacter sp. 676]|uniref:Response regulator transcription factor n=1 Tax=Dyadobacter sp. 676 TaxID=3088362 RepID=A0AAU8FF57_9BACT